MLPLLLWLFCCYEAEKKVSLAVISLLVCSVKEDAPIYIFTFGVYLLLSKGKKELKTAIGLILLSIAYVSGAIYYLSNYGEGLMSGRFNNLMCSDSLLSIIKVIITNPAYIFSQIFNADKLEFIIIIFLPVASIIFTTKKYSNFILLIPLTFINLLPEYSYQHSIMYQYVFAPYAFIIYMCVRNLAEFETGKRKKILSVSVMLVFLIFVSYMYPLKRYLQYYHDTTDTRECIIEAMGKIPHEASVTASARYLPQLASRDVIYELKPTDVQNGVLYESDYIVYDIRPDFKSESLSKDISAYHNAGYYIYFQVDDVILLMRREVCK